MGFNIIALTVAFGSIILVFAAACPVFKLICWFVKRNTKSYSDIKARKLAEKDPWCKSLMDD